MKLTPEVAQAIDEIRASFDGQEVDVDPDGSGGAWVTVYDCDLSEKYTPSLSGMSFALTFQYPDADVYPHFAVTGLARRDGAPLAGGFGTVKHPHTNQLVTQISRRSNKRNALSDTAATKLWKVLTWMKKQ